MAREFTAREPSTPSREDSRSAHRYGTAMLTGGLPEGLGIMTATAAQASATGEASYTEPLPREPASAGRSRRLMGYLLATWHLPALQEVAELVVSELVTNAVEHTRADWIRVTITRLASGGVRIGVLDSCSGEPSPRQAGPGNENGRGLAIVTTVCAQWGVDSMQRGKRVWADLHPASGVAGGAS